MRGRGGRAASAAAEAKDKDETDRRTREKVNGQSKEGNEARGLRCFLTRGGDHMPGRASGEERGGQRMGGYSICVSIEEATVDGHRCLDEDDSRLVDEERGFGDEQDGR